ncbi:uncharacterized protein B0H18DRAFT_1039403 [Fomitopsis serialis]|uniref:uncharacterized protein n=1 Tax=Fomitopsis serialis TaxID=139415 RepID=UPI002007392B|nr:uncharacterized protein B0H18DRAFT_1039403 [Neoantrodia serialis]KAH9916040.1 hypothetical protein B0H18DRAFT_1039403 [Neoantrodia serialis]
MFHAGIRHRVRSFALSLSFLGAATVRHSSTAYLLRTPPSSAPREVPTPLVFVSSSSWDPHSKTGFGSLATMLTARGFTCLEIDLAPPERADTSDALMRHFEAELSSHIRLTMIPFAPIIFARGSGALIAQTYISSHPASGLLLISPPVSNATLKSSSEADGNAPLPTALPEFNFEPRFPCAILCTQQETKALAENRLWKDENVSKLIARNEQTLDGQEGFVKIEQWLDEVGV